MVNLLNYKNKLNTNLNRNFNFIGILDVLGNTSNANSHCSECNLYYNNFLKFHYLRLKLKLDHPILFTISIQLLNQTFKSHFQ